MMREFNYAINLIPDFKLNKKLLDITPVKVYGRDLNISPIMTTNLLIVEKNTKKYMSDKLAMLYNSIIRDKTLVVTGNGIISRSYIIKYINGKLSITFGNKLTLTVTLSKKMTSLIDDDKYKYNRTNVAVMLYVASAIMNIPKYEYPINIIDSDTNISSVSINNHDVLYTYNSKDTSPYPKKLKKLNKETLELINKLRDRGDVISCTKRIGESNITRVLSLINYCRYYDVVTPKLINSLLSNVSSIKLEYDHLENMIAYMHIYKELLNIKNKYEVHVPTKHFK
jgi:hypothetical protein